ncbi:BstXI family restriction endonuclease [Staphylococcus epidermidis]|uniref:BstXI family restriction endonuclease n=1 Tax=Staphylococcus epidermidis TaxID=1282 RepID=UPI003975D904
MSNINSKVAYDVFPYALRKKLDKTKEARTGKGIYKRRNSRNYRVIMSYSTFVRLSEKGNEELDKYKNGYIVRIQPQQYFEGGVKDDERIMLGKNAFIYYKSIHDYRKYPPKEEWEQVVELYTSSKKMEGKPEWTGEYAAFIQNTSPQITSHICGDDKNVFNGETKKEYINRMNEKYRPFDKKLPKQAGIGNFDYDYCTNKEMDLVILQLSYLIMTVPGMDEQLVAYYKEFGEEAKFYKKAVLLLEQGDDKYKEFYQKKLNELEKICDKYNLLNKDKLKNIRAISQSKNFLPVCPLCLETLNSAEFLEIADQVEGREEEDNTRSKIALMHINALRPGEFNHRTYNLAWGHRMCNTIQEDMSLEETLQMLNKIIKNNENREKKNDIIEEQNKL